MSYQVVLEHIGSTSEPVSVSKIARELTEKGFRYSRQYIHEVCRKHNIPTLQKQSRFGKHICDVCKKPVRVANGISPYRRHRKCIQKKQKILRCAFCNEPAPGRFKRKGQKLIFCNREHRNAGQKAGIWNNKDPFGRKKASSQKRQETKKKAA